MGRHPAPHTTGHGVKLPPNASAHASPPPLFSLPTDVWLHIFAHLHPNAITTLAALSATCRHHLLLVDEHGWRHALRTQYISVSVHDLDTHYREYVKRATEGSKRSARSRWWFACRYALLLHRCWEGIILRSGSLDLPTPAQKKTGAGGARGRRFGLDFAIPALVVGSRWIVVGVRSEILLYAAKPAKRQKQGELVARIKVNSRAPIDQRPISSSAPSSTADENTASDDPWQDINTLRWLDEETSKIVVGYADGCVQVLALSLKTEGKALGVGATVLQHLPCARRQEVADVSLYTTTSTSSVPSDQPTLIASLHKRGLLQIHATSSGSDSTVNSTAWRIDSEGLATPDDPLVAVDESSGATTPRTHFRSAAFNNAPLALPTNGPTAGSATRAWSVLLGGIRRQKWLAVGMTAEHAVYIYPLTHTGGRVTLNEPFYIASTGQRTSVYAMATAPAGSSIPSYLLFAGCYDGVVRVYDTRQLRHAQSTMDMQLLNEALESSPNGHNLPRRHRRIRRELDPVAIFREDYDTDAVYSLAFGGPRSTWLLVGGSRHAKVRLFDASMLSEYDVPLLSPPSAVEDRTEGGDWTAFALPNTDSPQYGLAGAADRIVGVTDRKVWWLDLGLPLLTDAGSASSIAYFRHRDGALSYSQPVFPLAHT